MMKKASKPSKIPVKVEVVKKLGEHANSDSIIELNKPTNERELGSGRFPDINFDLSMTLRTNSSCAANFLDYQSPPEWQNSNSNARCSSISLSTGGVTGDGMPFLSETELDPETEEDTPPKQRINVLFASILSNTSTSSRNEKNGNNSHDRGINTENKRQFYHNVASSSKAVGNVENSHNRGATINNQSAAPERNSRSLVPVPVHKFTPQRKEIIPACYTRPWKSDKNFAGNTIISQRNQLGGARNFSTDTYEANFYRRKALSEKQPSYYSKYSSGNSSPGNAGQRISGCGYADKAQFYSNQHAVYRKIVHQKIYEYDDEEKSSNRSSISVPVSPRRAIILKQRVDKPVIKKRSTQARPPSSSVSTTQQRQSVNQSKSKGKLLQDGTHGSSKQEPKFALMTLPGQNDQLPKSRLKRDQGESTTEERSVTKRYRNTNSCQKCKTLKHLLVQSENRFEYITDIIKDLINGNINEQGKKGEVEGRTVPISPLVFHNKASTNFNFSEQLGSTPAATAEKSKPRAAADPCSFPTFDTEEFIHKYFRSLLYTKDFDNCPFTPLEFYHVAISTRDCMAQVIRQKLKNADKTLKKQYDVLLKMKASSRKQLDDSVFLNLVNSYRRFIRFIYHYLKKSIEQVEKFDYDFLNQQENEGTDEPNCKMIYSKEQVVTINGEKYMSVVIPIRKATQEDEH